MFNTIGKLQSKKQQVQSESWKAHYVQSDSWRTHGKKQKKNIAGITEINDMWST